MGDPLPADLLDGRYRGRLPLPGRQLCQRGTPPGAPPLEPGRAQAADQPAPLGRPQPSQVQRHRLQVLGPAEGKARGEGRELLQVHVEVAGGRGEGAEPLELRCRPGGEIGRQEVAEQLDRRAAPPHRHPEVVQELDVDVRHGAVPGGLQLVEEGQQRPRHGHVTGKLRPDHRRCGRVRIEPGGLQRRRVAGAVVGNEPGTPDDPTGARGSGAVSPQRDHPQPTGQSGRAPGDRCRPVVDQPHHGLALRVAQAAGDRAAGGLHHRQQGAHPEHRLQAGPQLVGKAGQQARPAQRVGPGGDGGAAGAAELQGRCLAVRPGRGGQRQAGVVQPPVGAVQPGPPRPHRAAHRDRVRARQRAQGGGYRRGIRSPGEVRAVGDTHSHPSLPTPIRAARLPWPPPVPTIRHG